MFDRAGAGVEEEYAKFVTFLCYSFPLSRSDARNDAQRNDAGGRVAQWRGAGCTDRLM
jgi:hypothetical protein